MAVFGEESRRGGIDCGDIDAAKLFGGADLREERAKGIGQRSGKRSKKDALARFRAAVFKKPFDAVEGHDGLAGSRTAGDVNGAVELPFGDFPLFGEEEHPPSVEGPGALGVENLVAGEEDGCAGIVAGGDDLRDRGIRTELSEAGGFRLGVFEEFGERGRFVKESDKSFPYGIGQEKPLREGNEVIGVGDAANHWKLFSGNTEDTEGRIGGPVAERIWTVSSARIGVVGCDGLNRNTRGAGNNFLHLVDLGDMGFGVDFAAGSPGPLIGIVVMGGMEENNRVTELGQNDADVPGDAAGAEICRRGMDGFDVEPGEVVVVLGDERDGSPNRRRFLGGKTIDGGLELVAVGDSHGRVRGCRLRRKSAKASGEASEEKSCQPRRTSGAASG